MNEVSMAFLAAGIGAALTTIGAALGIGRIAGQAMDGIARQPEAVGEIRVTMIIGAALIEGIALFAEVICFLLSIKTIG